MILSASQSSVMRRLLQAFLLTLLFAAGAVRAALTIEIVGGGANQIPVAIVPFGGEEGLPQSITQVVSADLARSGLFKLVDRAGISPLPVEAAEVRYPDWAQRGAEAIAVGSVAPQGDGRLQVRFQLLDVAKQSQLAGMSYLVQPSQLRVTAHKIADVIYE
jgi:TolB protein